MELVEDVVLVAVAMGGESTHPKLAIKSKSVNSSRPPVEVQACRASWMVLRRVHGSLHTTAAARDRAKKLGECGFGCVARATTNAAHDR
jgi:hypothetical protein